MGIVTAICTRTGVSYLRHIEIEISCLRLTEASAPREEGTILHGRSWSVRKSDLRESAKSMAINIWRYIGGEGCVICIPMKS